MALVEHYTCDKEGCEETTPKANPQGSWVVVMWLKGHIDKTNSTVNKDEKHYCQRRHVVDDETTEQLPESEQVVTPAPPSRGRAARAMEQL